MTYAARYGRFLAAAGAAMRGDLVRHTLALGGDGRGPATATVTRVPTAGPSAAEVADTLGGCGLASGLLGGLPDNTRAAGLGPQEVYGAGQAGIRDEAVSGTGVEGLGDSSGIGAGGAFGVFGTATGRRGTRLFGLTPLVAVVGLAAALAGCGGSTSPVAAPSGSRLARDACALVTAAGLRSLGVTGAGSRQKITRGTAKVYGCTRGHPPGRELHLQFEPLDPAAASQVRVSLGDQGTVVPGVGDGARGQVGSVLAAVNFSKGSTFVAIELFGTGAGGRKAAFLAVARDVASRL